MPASRQLPIVFVTGTDTGVGKTVLTALLARHLRQQGVNVAALKPVCSGGRDDARILQRALSGSMSLDEINPWHFPAPLAPPFAAAMAKRRLNVPAVLRHVRDIARRHELTLVEGAGGLLSPLAGAADNRALLRALRARPVVLVSNRLGAINQTLLVHAALSAREQEEALWVLVAPRRESLVHRLNLRFLRGRLGAGRVFTLPFLSDRQRTATTHALPDGATRALSVLSTRLLDHGL